MAALPGVRLVIVGGGPAEAAARRALPGALFLGPRHGEQLAAFYASLDVFVHAGRMTRSATRSRRPRRAACRWSHRLLAARSTWSSDGVTGFLVAPCDAGALAAAVARLASDPALRAAQGQAARRRMLGRTWPALGDELIDHYQAVLEGTEPRVPIPAGAPA